MRTRSRKLAAALSLVLGGAFLFAGPGTGCMSFFAESALSTADFCFIFDCQNGIFGGTVDPCPPADANSGGAILTPPTGPTFVDCP